MSWPITGFLLFRGNIFSFAVNDKYFKGLGFCGFFVVFFFFLKFCWILIPFPGGKSCRSQQKNLFFYLCLWREWTYVEASGEIEGVTHFETSALDKSQCLQFQKLPIQQIYLSLKGEYCNKLDWKPTRLKDGLLLNPNNINHSPSTHFSLSGPRTC